MGGGAAWRRWEEEESAQHISTQAPVVIYPGGFLGTVPDPATPTAVPNPAAPKNVFVEAVPDPAASTNIFYFIKLLILYFLYHKNTK